jgi:hypothetical protein
MTGAAIDRIHFLDEQRRNRRRSLRFSVFTMVAVGLAGIPLCVLASPLLFGIVLRRRPDRAAANLETINPRSVAHGCYIILFQIPLIATVGLASIAAKQSIGLFTTLVLGPWLAAMWRGENPRSV